MRYSTLITIPITVAIAVLLMACAPSPEAGPTAPSSPLPMSLTSPLLGTWQKVSTGSCAQPYPAVLQLQEGQIYTSQPGADQGFTLWDVGEYEVLSDREIRISTANDAMRSYRYALSEGTLTITDADDCDIQYRRV